MTKAHQKKNDNARMRSPVEDEPPKDEFEVLHYQNYNPISDEAPVFLQPHEAISNAGSSVPASSVVDIVFIRSINDPYKLDRFEGDDVMVMGRYHKLHSILQRYYEGYKINDKPVNFSERTSELDNNAFVCIKLPNSNIPAVTEKFMKHGFHIQASHCTTLDKNLIFIELVLGRADIHQNLLGQARPVRPSGRMSIGPCQAINSFNKDLRNL